MNIWRAILLIAIQCCAMNTLATTDSITNEYQIKAAYLYKFAAYVEWPPSVFAQANSPVMIGVIGADEIATALSNLKQERSANNRDVEIKLFKPGDPIVGVQMLFVGQKESGHLKSLLGPIQSQPVLVVTESDRALDAGSVINFLFVEEHIRFEVSVTQAERNGLKISSRLLSVAQKIEARRP